MELRRESTLCFSGHRAVRREEREALYERVLRSVDIFVRRGYDTFICGGAVGFDTMAAEAVAEKKRMHPHIRLVLALPCRDQTAKWKNTDALFTYKKLLGEADEVVYASNFYTAECMHIRNRYMVENSSACICYKYNERGGTAYTVKYAEKQGLEIINLAARTEQLTIDFS